MQLIIDKCNLQRIFIFFVLAGLSSGSAFYILDTNFKPAVVFPLLSIPFFLLSSRLSLDKASLLILLYVFIAAIYNMALSGREGLIDLIYIAFIFVVYMGAKLAAQLHLEGKSRSPAWIIIIIYFCTIILYLYELSSGRILVEKYRLMEGLYSSTFNNPNDFATYIVVFTPLIIYFVNDNKRRLIATGIIYSFLIILLVLLGSRLALLLMLASPFIYLLINVRIIYSVIAIIVAIVLSQVNIESAILFLGKDSEVVTRSASKISSALYYYGSDNSINYRMDSYNYAISNILDTINGTGSKNYSGFYGSKFAGTVVGINPHSFIIETTIAFGWLGLAIVLSLLGTITHSIFRIRKIKNVFFYGVASLLILSLASNIPSTIFRLPILFFPVFYFFHLSRMCYLSEKIDFESAWKPNVSRYI